MSRKIFVSYKYADRGVHPLLSSGIFTTARHYVDEIISHLDYNDHIYKGENDNESLQDFKDETIETKLKSKIHDSTITIVLISKNMVDPYVAESEQWIPWEISYSLKEITRNGRTSFTNAILAVVIPDEIGSYSYAVNHHRCVIVWNTGNFFEIIASNMFNRNQKNQTPCSSCNNSHHRGSDHSYIHPVRWVDFISNVNGYIETATQIQSKAHEYSLRKTI